MEREPIARAPRRYRPMIGIGMAVAALAIAALALLWLSRPLPPALDEDPPTRMAIRDREGRGARGAPRERAGGSFGPFVDRDLRDWPWRLGGAVLQLDEPIGYLR